MLVMRASRLGSINPRPASAPWKIHPNAAIELERKQKKELPARRTAFVMFCCLFLLHAGGNEEELRIHKHL